MIFDVKTATRIMDIRLLLMLAAVFLSGAPLFFSVLAKGTVLRCRQKHILGLEQFFDDEEGEDKKKRGKPDDAPASATVAENEPAQVIKKSADPNLVRSLEFLKFKYGLPPGKKGDDEEKHRPIKCEEIQPHVWFASGLLLFLLLLLLMLVAAAAIDGLTCPTRKTWYGDLVHNHRSATLVLLASIAGAYTYMLRAFYQAVQNFDLEPSSFFGAANNLIFGITVTQVAVFYVAESAEKTSTGTSLLMIIAFIGAYMPDDILRYFLNLSSIKQLKQERSDFGREIEGIPVEVLDGVDSKVRYRLSDYHIEDVQSLASANPLMLFVETPYGFYQTLDWVAQAQLCASVGPDATFKLRKLGLRTIFDLERATLSPGFVDDDVLKAIQRIILPDLVGPTPWTRNAIEANVRTRLDGSDTRRLRQIVLRVNLQIGGDKVLSMPEKG